MLHSELTGRALKSAIIVHRALGPGYPEAMYQAALELELRAEGLKVARECPIVVLYRGFEIGEFRADLIVEDTVVLELKALSELGKGDHRQLLNYLRVSEYEVGLLLNFGTDRLQPARKIFTNDLKPWLQVPVDPKEWAKRPELAGVRRVRVNDLRCLEPHEAEGNDAKKTA